MRGEVRVDEGKSYQNRANRLVGDNDKEGGAEDGHRERERGMVERKIRISNK